VSQLDPEGSRHVMTVNAVRLDTAVLSVTDPASSIELSLVKP